MLESDNTRFWVQIDAHTLCLLILLKRKMVACLTDRLCWIQQPWIWTACLNTVKFNNPLWNCVMLWVTVSWFHHIYHHEALVEWQYQNEAVLSIQSIEKRVVVIELMATGVPCWHVCRCKWKGCSASSPEYITGRWATNSWFWTLTTEGPTLPAYQLEKSAAKPIASVHKEALQHWNSPTFGSV